MTSPNPFKELDKTAIQELLVGIEKNFSKAIVKGEVVHDHSKHFELYLTLLRYCHENQDGLTASNGFTSNMNYGGWVLWLLNEELTLKK